MDSRPIWGWQKDKFDPRDYIHKLKLVAIPPVVILDAFLPAIRDQGSVGSCVGFGIGANLVARDKKLAQYLEWYSPTWIYNGARYIEGTLTLDVGCQPRDALHWLYMKGCLLEHFWVYDEERLDTTPPPSHLEPEAAKHPLLAYYRVTNGVEGICSALAEEHHVSIGTPWFDKWMNPEDGELAKVTALDTVAGGHETCLYGYDGLKKVVYGLNSWGEGWGNKGLYTMPFSAFDVFKQRGGYDAHYIGWEAAPEEPEEKESTCSLARGYVWFGNFLAHLIGSRTRLPHPIRI